MLSKIGKGVSVLTVASLVGMALAMLYPEIHSAICVVK